MSAATGPSAAGKIHLVELDDAEPTIKVRLGHRFEVRSISIVDPQLNPTKKVAARLCGGTDTCLALVEI